MHAWSTPAHSDSVRCKNSSGVDASIPAGPNVYKLKVRRVQREVYQYIKRMRGPKKQCNLLDNEGKLNVAICDRAVSYTGQPEII